MKRITSRQNPIVARYRRAARGGSAEGPGSADDLLLDGVHLIEEALASGVRLSHAAAAADALDEPEIDALIRRLSHEHLDVVSATAPVMAAISPVRSPSRIVALAMRPPDRGPSKYSPQPLVLVAFDIQDPGNMGAIVRVAEATGAAGVVAAGACASPFGWKALRGSMGSALRLPIAIRPSVESALVEVRQAGCRLLATVPQGGTDVMSTTLTGPVAVLIGGEGGGLPPEVARLADACVTIPMKAPVESLNTAVAAAVILYEAWRQRGLPGTGGS